MATSFIPLCYTGIKPEAVHLTPPHKVFVLSGPIPAMFKNDEHFSRLLSLNSWMKNYCLATEAEFINNFNTFWTQRDLFKADGLHPNMKGVKRITKHFIDFIAYKIN